MNLLKMDHVSKYFPIHRGIFRREVESIKAVRDVDLTIRYNEVHALVGESGSGKSTLGRMAAYLIPPTKGVVLYKDKDLNLETKIREKDRHSIQMIFQDPLSSLNPRFTILESMKEALILHKIVPENEVEEVVIETLETVGLSKDMMYRYPHQLSGGQQQRACIGRAISLKPEMLICDEVVSALDVSVQAQVLNLLSNIQQRYKLSYLFISHDLSTVHHFSDRMTILYLGKVMETGDAKTIFNHPKHPYTQALLNSILSLSPDNRKKTVFIKGEIPSQIDPPSGCPFRTRCPYAQEICKLPPPKKKVEGKDQTYFCILD